MSGLATTRELSAGKVIDVPSLKPIFIDWCLLMGNETVAVLYTAQTGNAARPEI
jgi:hypothetical protein